MKNLAQILIRARARQTSAALRQRRRRRRSRQRGVALIMVLGALTILAVMLAEFQDETSAELGSALSHRDAVKAEYAARSAVNLSRLLIASEPTIRKAMAPLFLLMRRGPPQIPVWEFSDRVLGAFNDEKGTEAFKALAGVDIEEGEHLGFDGAGFEVRVVDEDSKINLNVAARGDAFSQARLAQQLIGLLAGPQNDPLFENRDSDGQFSDRQTICGAIVDWVDSDQDAYVCDPHSGTAQQAGAEDSFYQLLKKPYKRKNAAFDSLEELHMIRGVGDDFWATFIDPEPDKPEKRVVTVWGQGKINVNTANGQAIYSVVCGAADLPKSPLCTDPTQAATFLTAMTMVKGFTAGAPLFGSTKAFLNALKGRGMVGKMLETVGLKPVVVKSESELAKAITTESKVFSIYATGVVKVGKRETRVRVHSVVDFRGAPAVNQNAGAAGLFAALNPNKQPQPTPETDDKSNLPEGATESAIASAFQPGPGGTVIYFRID